MQNSTSAPTTAVEAVYRFLEFQENFQSKDLVEWHRSHAEIPVFAVSFYMIMVFAGPNYMKNREAFKLKGLFAAWNLLLSVFSILGAYHMVPLLVKQVYTHGFWESICNHPEWYYNNASGLWLSLFIYSKFAELADTAFLVLRKRNVIFLHWFHHLTVLLYCWHAYHNSIGAGAWFACMNYCVHSIMYFYYFMTNIGLYRVVAPFAQFITTIQILQMVGGMAVLLFVGQQTLLSNNESDKVCHADLANTKMGLAMYCSYFILFCMLFAQKYLVTPASKQTKAGSKSSKGPSCPPNVDATGLFHTEDAAMQKKKV